MADKNGKHALADTNTYMRISISPCEYPYAHTYVYAHKHVYITTHVHIYIIAPECVCYIKSFTVKQRKYSINSSINLYPSETSIMQISLLKHDKYKNEQNWYAYMYMRRRICQSDRIAITVRTGGCRVDNPRYGQQYMPLCRHRLFNSNFALWKAVYMNLPNAFKTRGSSLVRRNFKALIDSISQMFSYFVDILEDILLRSWSYILQMSRK